MEAFNWNAMTLSTREATMGQVFRTLVLGRDSGARSSGRSAVALVIVVIESDEAAPTNYPECEDMEFLVLETTRHLYHGQRR